MRPVKVTASLANELSGNPRQLDALLIKARARFHPSAGAHERYDPVPDPALLPPIPIHRETYGGWIVHRCSAPIMSPVASDRHQRISQHFPRELSTMLADGERGTIATTNGQQKSYWLPERLRLVRSVVWFAMCHDSPSMLRRELKRSVTHVGPNRSTGRGRVAEWSVELADEDLSWFAPHPQGTVLMRSLPWGDWLPRDLIGYMRDSDAVLPPYWHAGRKTEIVRPC